MSYNECEDCSCDAPCAKKILDSKQTHGVKLVPLKPKFTHTYSFKNDGRPNPYSAEQRALDEALVAFHNAGYWEYDSITLVSQPCDDSSHYPDLCYHLLITIEGGRS